MEKRRGDGVHADADADEEATMVVLRLAEKDDGLDETSLWILRRQGFMMGGKGGWWLYEEMSNKWWLIEDCEFLHRPSLFRKSSSDRTPLIFENYG